MEQARIKIVDASGKKALGESLKKKLATFGYTISRVEIISATQKNSTLTYSADKPYTLALLKRRFGIRPTENKAAASAEDIVFTIGNSFTWR